MLQWKQVFDQRRAWFKYLLRYTGAAFTQAVSSVYPAELWRCQQTDADKRFLTVTRGALLRPYPQDYERSSIREMWCYSVNQAYRRFTVFETSVSILLPTEILSFSQCKNR